MSKITIDLTKTVKEIITTMKGAIDSLQDQLTFDTTPTAGSSNPVTSDGIKKAIDAKTVDLSNHVSYTNNTVTVAGTSKTVSKTSPETLYVGNGLIMGGTAQDAGLVTRGVCGVMTPGSDGACSKDCLYVNYDGNNTNNPTGRGLILNAGLSGNSLGNGMYQYAVPRGDVVKAWVEAKGYLTTHQDLSSYAKKADLSSYQTKLTFDSTPTANSSNPVTSAGIKAAIDAKTVDLSNYYTKAQVDSAISTAISGIVDGDSKSY